MSAALEHTGVLFSNDAIDFFVVIPVAAVVKGQKVSFLTRVRLGQTKNNTETSNP